MFELAFKNIDDVLWKEAGCTTELDYTEQTSWLLFLKCLDGLEQDRADEAGLSGKKYGEEYYTPRPLIRAMSIDQSTFDLSVRNPNGGEEVRHRSPQEIMEEIAKLDAESARVLVKIKELL